MRWGLVLVLVLLAACKPKPDPVCQAARARLAECPRNNRDKWDQNGVDECVHDIRKASTADVLDGCNKLASCEEARACITTTLTAAARK